MGSEFWITQPVGRGKSVDVIDANPVLENLPTRLPSTFYWTSINDIPRITQFLENFYVEDVTSKYRLSYSNEFFEFLFNHPKHKDEYSLGLFHNQELIGYILAREHILVIKGTSHNTVSINFLCLDKEYRNKNFAPLMIKEITRIANLNGIFKAIFTAERDYGFAIASARYYHFPIKSETLLKANIIDYCDEVLEIPVLRKDSIILEDPTDICNLYNNMTENYDMHEEIKGKVFNQIFQGKDNVFVTIYNIRTGEFASFFIIGTKCMDSGLLLKRAYLYYWSGSNEIIKDAIFIASSMNVDMFDVLNIARNHCLIKELNLIEGSGTLKYHLFNMGEKILENSDINFILF